MPAQTHLISRTLKTDKKVHVFFSVAPARKAILFIHGFTGAPLTTWSDFPHILRQNKKFSGHDLYFYGYDGLRAPVGSSASLFRQFLEKLLGDTKMFRRENLSPAAKDGSTFEYEELIIVGHSLGAVVARRVLIDATRKGLPWVSRIRLVLYAPAHKGAKVGDLVLETVSGFPFLKWFSGAARFVSPLIDELDPEKSDILEKLLSETLALCAEGRNTHLIAQKVVWAEQENIVTNEDFGHDPLGFTLRATTHTSVCKPKPGFREPLTCLEECL